MLKIKITKYTFPDGNSFLQHQNKYALYLGNGVTHYFTSETYLTIKINSVNKELNRILSRQLNINAELYQMYMQLWRFFDDPGLLDPHFEDISVYFRKIILRQNGTNYNSFVFSWLRGVINCMAAIINEYTDFMRLRQQYIYKSRIDHLNIELSALKTCLEKL